MQFTISLCTTNSTYFSTFSTRLPKNKNTQVLQQQEEVEACGEGRRGEGSSGGGAEKREEGSEEEDKDQQREARRRWREEEEEVEEEEE